MDALKACADAFTPLLDTEYIYKLGRKGKLVEIHLSFEKTDFHHLVGLHKLKDIEQLRSGAREDIFDRIVQGEITQEQIEKSAFYNDMSSRIAVFPYIGAFLEDTNLYFRYDPKINAFSAIKADFVIEGLAANTDVYLFLDKRAKDTCHFCRTFFPREETDYTRNLPKFTLLYKEKRNSADGTSIVQYNKLS